MIIVIPSVTKYIQDSRKNAYIVTAKEYIAGVRNKVNSSEFEFFDINTTYYVPNTCVELESGGDSPFGKFVEGQTYVVVTYDGDGYNYYWTSRDDSNMGIHLTYEALLDTDKVQSDVESISTDVGVGEREKVKVLGSSCKVEDAVDKDADMDINIADKENFDGVIPERISLYKEVQMTAENNKGAKEYTGNGADTFANKVYYYTGDQDTTKNNVIFAKFCWKIVRTTETGGIKLIYNGVPSADGKCNNTGTATQIGTSVFNSSAKSPVYVGYMYNPTSVYNYQFGVKYSPITTKYGSSFTYTDGKYKLSEENIKQFSDWYLNYNQLNYNHYTCFNVTGECTTLSYIYKTDSNYAYYINLTGGKSVEDALKEIFPNDEVNVKDSTIKTYIDTWYKENMTEYTTKLEDTVFCNDRSIYQLNGWNPNGGYITNSLLFGAARRRETYNPDLTCANRNDRFTTSASNGNGKLTYPVGLLTYDEVGFVGWSQVKTGQYFWLMTPYGFGNYYADEYEVRGGYTTFGTDAVLNTLGVRPSVSLKPGTGYRSGDGSTDSPFIVK